MYNALNVKKFILYPFEILPDLAVHIYRNYHHFVRKTLNIEIYDGC